MPNDPDARLRLQEAFQAAASAHLHLFMVLDSAMSYGGLETFRIPTDVLLALDASREAEATLFQYLPEPGISSAQVENAWQHAVAQAEAMTGPTQDQEPCNICGFTPDKQDQDEEEESPERSGELDPIVMGPISPYTHDRLPWE